MNLKDFINKNVLLVDATHGGLILAKKLRDFCANPVVLDIYKTIDSKREKELIKDGIKIEKDVSISKNELKFDVVSSPVHSPILNPILCKNSPQKIISHHEMTKILLKRMLSKKTKVIEVTGLKGKTSTTTILKEILIEAENKVLASTSLETVYENPTEKIPLGKPSITPANVISVLERAIDEKLDLDFLLFETSLGFTGAAKTNVLTSINKNYDYLIAGGKLCAITSKMFTTGYLEGGGQLILEMEDYDQNTEKFSSETVTTYGFNKKADIYAKTIDNRSSKMKIEGGLHNFNVVLSEQFFGKIHQKNALSAITAALSVGIDIDSIKSSLKKSVGIAGRMQKLKRGGQIIIDNSNPTLNPVSLDMAIKEVKSYAKKCGYKNRDIAVVVGGNKSYCIKTDYLGLKDIIEKYNLTFFLSGKIGKRLKEIGSDGKLCMKPEPKEKIVLLSVQK